MSCQVAPRSALRNSPMRTARKTVPGLAQLDFFFQAEDVIRDLTVTGVQTCALPIWGGLTGYASDASVNLIVLGDMSIQAGGAFALDGEGFPQSNGPGAGGTLAYTGAGGAYGGVGGASSLGAAGGGTYGSAVQPIDRGSGGGLGNGPVFGSSSAGVALRL